MNAGMSGCFGPSVRAIIAQVTHKIPATIELDSRWRALGVDSLDVLEIVLQCEQAFTIAIPDQQVVTMRTIRDLVLYIESVVPSTPHAIDA